MNLAIAEFPAIRWKVWTCFKPVPFVKMTVSVFCCAHKCLDYDCFVFKYLPDGEAILDSQGMIEPIGRSLKKLSLSLENSADYYCCIWSFNGSEAI